VMSNEILSRE